MKLFFKLARMSIRLIANILYLFHVTQDAGENYYVGGGLFLLVFIAIGAFVFANLVVAVVVTNLVSTLPIHVVPRWRFSRLASRLLFNIFASFLSHSLPPPPKKVSID